jgi:hypothetical protein
MMVFFDPNHKAGNEWLEYGATEITAPPDKSMAEANNVRIGKTLGVAWEVPLPWITIGTRVGNYLAHP